MRAIYTLSVQRPQPDNTNLLKKKEEKGKTVEYEKVASILGQRKNIGPALETRPSRTTEKGSAR